MNRLKTKVVLFGYCCAGALIMHTPVLAQDKGTEPSLTLNPEIRGQLTALFQEKAARTTAQRKMSSQLVLSLKAQRGELQGSGLEAVRSGAGVAADGNVLVDIRAEVTPALLAEIEKLGGRIVSSHAEYDAVRAYVPFEFIESLADEEEVRFIKPADRAFHNKVNTSEGDLAHVAASSRTKYKLTGKGVKVGVLSDSVDYLSAVQATGDLPAVTVLAHPDGTTPTTGEGTAMLEIVHDLAPEAQLYFATAWNGVYSFADNIKALANAGCKVIVDDVGYLGEAPFQDDVVTQAVNTVTGQGVLYFSAAGNGGNLSDGTSGTWEGNYLATTSQVQGYSSVHDFGGGDWANRITKHAGCVTLFWADPLGGSANDYDLFLVDPGLSTIVGESSAYQDGNDDPFEGFCVAAGEDITNYHLLVAKWSGQDRFLHLNAFRGRIERATAGQIAGHPAAQNAFAVSAVSAANRSIPFSGGERVETFTSDGPRRVFFNANGTAITPGNYSATGGTVRSKPDIAAADGVKTATPGFNPFYGTSAAAPHAAAIGALMLSGKPKLTIAEVRLAFQNTALDIEAPGSWDRDSGYGIIRADYVLEDIGPFGVLSPGILQLLLLK
jgi:hypothetical protein